MNGIHPVYDGDQWRALVDTVTNLWVPQLGRIFITKYVLTSQTGFFGFGHWRSVYREIICELLPIHTIIKLTDKQYTCKGNIETRSRNHCCRGKAVLHILSVCL